MGRREVTLATPTPQGGQAATGTAPFSTPQSSRLSAKGRAESLGPGLGLFPKEIQVMTFSSS